MKRQTHRTHEASRVWKSIAHVLQAMIAASLATAWVNAAEPADLKTFASEESYIVDGAPVVLKRVPGEVTLKLGPGLQPANVFTAFNGATFGKERGRSAHLTIYKMRSDDPVTEAASKEAIDSLNQDPNVRFAYPVYADPVSGARVFLNDELVVRLKAQLGPARSTFFAAFDVELIDALSAGQGIYVVRLRRPKDLNSFSVCHALRQRDEVIWAEPNMTPEIQTDVLPNDTLFGNQWNLRNTGQTAAFVGADVEAAEAWDGSQGYGSPGIRIAILDSGVQTSHPDLNDNIIPGYDFADLDNDPNPAWEWEGHGTAVAGIAAAEVNNSIGVAGVAGKCKILPVRVSLGNVANLYRAIIYAADNADVINCSWHLPSPSSTVSSGFLYAWDYGRGGKGCPILCSSGNDAESLFGLGDPNHYSGLWDADLYAESGYVPRNNCRLRFEYAKDAAGAANSDCFWLADVRFPDGTTRQRFDSAALPLGWSHVAGDHANWTGSIDPVHAHGTTAYAWRSGAIGNNQWSGILSPAFNINAQQTTVTYRQWVESESGHDYAYFSIINTDGQVLAVLNESSGKPSLIVTNVNYPANLSYVLAVGASGDFDYRASYSQYGASLDFVAPSGGGYGAIATTDWTESYGFDPGDYTTTFSGTSAAAPLAAGIAALVLSKDGNLTRASVVSKLTQNCEKVGLVAYTGWAPLTRNNYYGHGRLNAKLAVNATTADATVPTFSSATVMNYRAVDAAFSEPMGAGAETPANYTITAGAGTLSANPAKVIRIKPTVYRLIWNSGDIVTSGTVTIQASSSIKDVAGNSLTTTSRNSSGTKRILALNCGGRLLESGYQLDYTPPYVSDNGFQGNEPAPYLTGTPLTISTGNYIDTSGVTDPAPIETYQSYREIDTSSPITYYLPNIPSGIMKVRLHFAEIYYAEQYYGGPVFDIYVNSELKTSDFNIWMAAGGSDKAVVLEYAGITVQAGTITVTLTPKPRPPWNDYHAAINGIEILKP